MAGLGIQMRRAGIVFALLSVLCSCGSKLGQNESPSAVDSHFAVDTPFTTFTQDLQASVKSVEISAGGTTLVPVIFHNNGQNTWASSGKYPVTIGYKWFDGGQILPMEGERTTLPRPVRPGESVNVQVKVVAPPSGKDLLLKVTLVQEGVQWFMAAGAKPLELRATLH